MAGHLDTFGDAPCPGNAGDWRRPRELTLPAAEQSAGVARHATSEVLTLWRLGHLADTALLLVSELVTNAVRHARNEGSTLALRLEITGISLRIEVHDTDPRWPQPGTPAGLDESGFGFVLVHALAPKWGVSDTPAGKAVWVELDTRPGREPGESVF
jgi:anti-sigma regulatory factor (Ser/Thr protein kinase)